jgi:O-antigen biosynthesis protein WbqP
MTSWPKWKSTVDYVCGCVLLVAAAIPMTLIAGGILAESGRPVLIRQRRIGRRGVEYLMWKFRTLPKETPQMAKSDLVAAGLNPTMFGRRLRRHSLDELPQLINVLTGEMSLVGPRPALYTQDDLTALRAAQGVLEVKPGLTGLAQVSGREDLSLPAKVALDAQYVRSMSFWLDLTIALRTVRAVLRPRGSF